MEFFHPGFFTLLFWLLVGHVLADYPLQGDYMARAKNHKLPEGKDISSLIMVSHALIHAGFVMLFTGSLLLAVCEFIAHTAIDTMKCDGLITYKQDQKYHFICKVVWATIFFIFIA